MCNYAMIATREKKCKRMLFDGERAVHRSFGVNDRGVFLLVSKAIPSSKENNAKIAGIVASLRRKPLMENGLGIADAGYCLSNVKGRDGVLRRACGRKPFIKLRVDHLGDLFLQEAAQAHGGRVAEVHFAFAGQEPVQGNARLSRYLDEHFGSGKPAIEIIPNGGMRKIETPGDLGHGLAFKRSPQALYKLSIHGNVTVVNFNSANVNSSWNGFQ